MRDPHDTCLEIENSLPLWAGGDLEPDAQTTVQNHLAVCARCSRAAIRARAARAALHQGMQVEAEAMGSGRDPWPAIRGVLRAERLVGSTNAPRALRTAQPVFRRPSLAWPIAAALLVGLFIAGTWLPSGPSPVRPPIAVLPAEGTRNPVRGPVQVADAAASPIPVLPAGLHRIAPGEPRLRDSALVFRVSPSASPDEVGADPTGSLIQPNNRGGSPVSLERVQLLPPR